MSSDIRPLGTADGVGKYWIKVPSGIPGSAGTLRLVLIDEHGQVEATPLGMAWDEAAMTRDEAVEYHLRGAVAEADRNPRAPAARGAQAAARASAPGPTDAEVPRRRCRRSRPDGDLMTHEGRPARPPLVFGSEPVPAGYCRGRSAKTAFRMRES
jgi:hypothetical protein